MEKNSTSEHWKTLKLSNLDITEKICHFRRKAGSKALNVMKRARLSIAQLSEAIKLL